MIITRLYGGLGNQMFQYAAGLALAQKRRTVLKLDVSWFRDDPAYEAHNQYALGCFNITEQFASQHEVDRVSGRRASRPESLLGRTAQFLRLRRLAELHVSDGNWHVQKQFPWYPEFAALPDQTYLDGTWQSERYLQDVAPLLRLHFSFRYPPQPAVVEMAKRIAGGPSAFVHFRRGDYVRNASFKDAIGVVSLDYYRKAVALLREKHPDVTLYVFSDDIDAIEREFQPPGPHVFVRATQPWHSFDKIRLMSGCQHGIISNSTFAWWGAWLNPAPNRTVIAPDPWFVNSVHDNSQVVPETWTRLPGWPHA